MQECLRLRGFDVLKDLTGRNLTVWTAGANEGFVIHMTWISVDIYTCVYVYVCVCVCVRACECESMHVLGCTCIPLRRGRRSFQKATRNHCPRPVSHLLMLLQHQIPLLPRPRQTSSAYLRSRLTAAERWKDRCNRYARLVFDSRNSQLARCIQCMTVSACMWCWRYF